MCVIVENTFTSIQEMAIKLVHPCVKLVPLCLYKNKVSFSYFPPLDCDENHFYILPFEFNFSFHQFIKYNIYLHRVCSYQDLKIR